ncbi:MAG: hypothetical protein LAT66_00755 [Alkalimonas sp.]|nr:hypothetical protein [Alkalimonas sp.]
MSQNEKSFRSMSKVSLFRLLSMLVVILILLVVKDQGYRIHNAAFIVIFLLFSAPLAVLLFWQGRLKRQAFYLAYVNDNSALYNRFLGGFFLLIIKGLFAIVLAINLVAGSILIDGFLYWIILMSSPFIWLTVGIIVGPLINTHVKRDFQVAIRTKIQVFLTGIFLMLLLVLASMYSHVDDLRGLSFAESYTNRTMSVYSQSLLLNIVMEFQILIDTFFLWLVSYSSEMTGSLPIRFLSWIIALFYHWLVVWPLMLLYQFIEWLFAARGIKATERGSNEI